MTVQERPLSEEDREICRRIRYFYNLRAAKEPGFNQSKFGAAAGASQPTVSRWLREERAPGRRALDRAIKALEIDRLLFYGTNLPCIEATDGSGAEG
jgi:transcriptional regulator with XRE-family HTH domain